MKKALLAAILMAAALGGSIAAKASVPHEFNNGPVADCSLNPGWGCIW